MTDKRPLCARTWGALLATCVTTLGACSASDAPSAAATVTAPPDAAATAIDAGDGADTADAGGDRLQGTWLAPAWGLALQAEDGVLMMYELTEISCSPYLQVAYEGSYIPELGARGKIDSGNLVLQLYGTSEITATPLTALPSICADGGTPATDDPAVAFEIFWRNFSEMYASFDIRDVDWEAQYEAFVNRVTPNTNSDELFALLCEMVQPFDDPHVSLTLGEGACESHPPPAWLQQDRAELMLAAVETYIYDGAAKTAGELIPYRVLPQNIGYVFIPSMGGYADTPAADLQTVGDAMDEIVAAFADVAGVIVDVRINGGGDDGIALAIASRFADVRRRAVSMQTRLGDGWTPRRDYYVEPQGPAQLTQPLVVLTSTFTVSSAEVFVLALDVLPHVSVLGETTAGALATMMYRNLPNGIGFTLPFERTFAADGASYERVGIPPDIAFAFDAEAFIDGNDKTLAAAVAYLTNEGTAAGTASAH